jgi:uncharacterized membrane protein
MATTRAVLRWAADRSLPAAVAASALAVVVLIAGPVLLLQRPTHRFLLWNLLLAWIPVIAALVLEEVDGSRRGRSGRPVVAFAAGVVWLLFLPNAPYLVSDLTHFDSGSATPWLDLARLVSFAWAGCLLAVVSLRSVHRVVLRRAGSLAAWAVVVASAIGSGFGVVLGRFSRLNSWQAFTAPRTVLAEVAAVSESGRLVAVSLFFGLLLLTVYLALGPPAGRVTTR